MNRRMQTGVWRAIGRFAGKSERDIVLWLIAMGALLRATWLATGDGLTRLTSESHNVAVSLATNGTFANPFATPSGSTAHIGMLTPLPSAIVYRLLGPDTISAEIVLGAVSIALVSTSFWLAWKISVALGVPTAGRLAATAIVTLLPLQFGLEVRESRNWEFLIATVLLLNVLRLIVSQFDHEAPRVFALGLWSGAAMLVSPTAGLATIFAIAVFCFARVPFRRWPLPAIAFLILVVPPSLAWQQRNAVMIGKPVPLRDNLGLELALSNHPGAVSGADEKLVYRDRMRAIHPASTAGDGFRRMQVAGGEARYYDLMMAEATDWIRSNPTAFALLCARHVRQIFFPPQWFWGTFGRGGAGTLARQATLWAVALAALVTLAVNVARSRRYWPVAVAILGCVIPYIAVQPMLRYRYLMSTLLIVLACEGVARLARHIGKRRTATTSRDAGAPLAR